jgi:amino acid adenylation domain-containing protein
MRELRPNTPELLSEQERIRARCFHPAGSFVEFKNNEVEQSVPNRFEQQVASHPDHIAISTGTQRLTYGRLNRIANRIARTILSHRGRKEEPIALLLGQDSPMIAALIAVMKAGKTCVPLDAAYPPTRTRDILGDTATRLIVTDNSHLSLAKELLSDKAHLINIDQLDSALSEENIGLNIAPGALAYILYTSASTGRPKGVTQTHRNALHSAMAYVNSLHIQTEDRLTLFAPCSGAQGMKTAVSALAAGASLHLWNVQSAGLADLANWLIAEGVTVFIAGATVFRSFVSTLRGGEQFPRLRIIKVGNEPVRRADVELYKKHFSPDCTFVNWFAATETGSITCYFIDGKTKILGNFVPVGYAFADTEILLLDDSGQSVGINQVGEIAIKSRYLSPGYTGQPDLTRAKFLSASNGEEERIYLSGDLGLRLPDGCLYHLGRKDFQVKVGGNRIEVGEVENALLALEDIQHAAVVTKHRGAETILVAYIVTTKKPRPSVGTLRRALAENLPEHMIPSAFVFLDSMPVAPNGKIDRRALPELDTMRPELCVPYVAPVTPVEEVLAKIWADVLGLDRVGIHDNFFDLGGHSLHATQVVSRVRRDLGVEVSLRALFDKPAIADLAEMVAECQQRLAPSPIF